MKSKKSLLFSAVTAALCISFAPADVIILDDGTRLEGRMEESQTDKNRIAFTTGASRLEFPKTRLKEIIEETDAQDFTRLGDQFQTAGNSSTAIQMYQQALEADPEYKPAREGMAVAQKAINEMQEQRVQDRQREIDEEIQKLNEVVQGDYNEEAFVKASTQLNELLTSTEISETQRQTIQRLTRDLYLAWGFARFDRLDNKGAEEKYLRVLEMDNNNEQAREALLKIWLKDPTKKSEVLRIYEQKLKEEPNNLEYNKIVADLLYDTQQYEKAIEPLKKVSASPRYVGQGYDTRLRRSYDAAIDNARNAGDLDRAIAITKEKITTFPNTDKTDLIVLQYESEKRKLPADDWDGRAMLVRKLQEIGLTQMAEREAELILKYDPENEIATKLLREQAETQFVEITEAMRLGQYAVARDLSAKFLREQNRFPDLQEKAQEQFNAAQIEVEKQAQAAREQARQIADMGNEYYEQAVRNVSLMNDENVRSDSRPISYKQEAIKYSKRAIDRYETALKIDPTLGGIENGGMDLNSRLRDARNLYNGLTDRPSYVPGPRNR